MALELTVQKRLAGFPLDLSFASDSRRIGILGPSGCGKSMTLKLLAGVVTPDRGHIQIGGRILYDSEKRISLPPKARQVGYLFQNYALFPAMTVSQNIAAGLRCPKRARQEQVSQLIRRFRLEGLENRRPGQISGGQQQRTALARMMAAQPQTILLDEPFSALDPALREAVQTELLEFLSDYPGQVIMVSHSLEELYRFCDFLAVIERGALLAAGDRDQLFRNPGSVPVARLLGCENILPAHRLDAHHLTLPDWNVTLTTAWTVPEAVSAAGIRAQALIPAEGPGENCFSILLRSRTETPFRCRSQVASPHNPAASPIWWEQGSSSCGCPAWLSVPPEQVLPLI